MCTAVLRSAVLSLAQVSTLSVQHEVLGLVRSILVQHLGSQHVRSLLLSLPSVTPEVSGRVGGRGDVLRVWTRDGSQCRGECGQEYCGISVCTCVR